VNIDLTSPSFIISQLLVVAGYVLVAGTYFAKKRENVLFLMLGANSLFTLAFVFLSAWAGMGMTLFAIARDLTNFASHRFNKKEETSLIDFMTISIFAGVIIVVASITVNSFLAILAPVATLLFTISIWQKNQSVYRFLGIIIFLLWCLYNLHVENYVGAVLDAFLLFVALFQFLTTRKKLTQAYAM